MGRRIVKKSVPKEEPMAKTFSVKAGKMFDTGEQTEELLGTLYYHPDNPGYIGRREVKQESSE